MVPVPSKEPERRERSSPVDASSTTANPETQGSRDSQSYSIAGEHAPVSSWSSAANSAHVSAGGEINSGFGVSPGISNDGYETALQGLLSLGTEATDANFGPPATSAGDTSYGDMDLRGTGGPDGQEREYPTSAPRVAGPAPRVAGVVALDSGLSDRSREHVLGLFRHYRYEIAPWVSHL